MCWYNSLPSPSPTTQDQWKIWILKPCRWFRFHSILFQSTETGSYFVIEPTINHRKLLLTPTFFDPSESKYQGRGFSTIEMSPVTMVASYLFHEVVNTLRNFEEYSEEDRRTCLLYCRKLGRNLQCIPANPIYAVVPEPEYQTWI